jgi:hypothetical protein
VDASDTVTRPDNASTGGTNSIRNIPAPVVSGSYYWNGAHGSIRRRSIRNISAPGKITRSHVLTFRDTFWPQLHHRLLVGGVESQIPFQRLRAEEAQAAATAGVGVAEGLQLEAA